MIALTAFLVGLAGYIALAFFATRRRDPRFGAISFAPRKLPEASRQIKLTTWNIGFAALGAQADFILDGGGNLRALKRHQIHTAAMAIAHHLAKDDADVVMLQENATAGFLTRQVPLRDIIEAALPDRAHIWWADMATVFAPHVLRLNHGLSAHVRVKTGLSEAIPISPAPMRHYGCLKKYYGAIVTRLPISGSKQSWVIINLHLSAFDTDARAKEKQLKTLFAFAEAAHAKGNPVVIGGDWNMEITASHFPSDGSDQEDGWTYDFPATLVPPGWKVLSDPKTPTVRAMKAPFQSGRTPTMIIDGFIVSPDVRPLQVQTADLSFAHTDHHPVTASIAWRPKQDRQGI